MLTKLELSYESHKRLIDHCNLLGIEFLSTAFDFESLSFLVSLGLKRLKIPSGELTNAPLILEHARTGCDLIVSTGMATLSEIEMALGVIAFGFINDVSKEPSLLNFQQAYALEKGQRLLKEKVTILHCTTEYPAPINEINLRAMKTLSQAFNLEAGYSDHSEGTVIPIAAVACGASLIEKHFTLDKNMEGPDHKASMEPSEFKAMINAIRQVEAALGSPVKVPTVSEMRNKGVARKSLVAEMHIASGEAFTKANLSIKRPGIGASPYLYWETLKRKASRDYQPGDLIVE